MARGRYTPLTERTKHLALEGWSFNAEAIRFSGREPDALAGQVHQVVIHLEDMTEEDLYGFARSLQDYAIGLERHASRLLDNTMQDEVPLP